jgi:hypothetical protein
MFYSRINKMLTITNPVLSGIIGIGAVAVSMLRANKNNLIGYRQIIRQSWREVFANGQQVPAAGGKSLFPNNDLRTAAGSVCHSNNDFRTAAGSVCRRTTTSGRRQEVFVTRTMCPGRRREVFVIRTMTSGRWREVFASEQRLPDDSRRCLQPNNNSPPAAGGFLTVNNQL